MILDFISYTESARAEQDDKTKYAIPCEIQRGNSSGATMVFAFNTVRGFTMDTSHALTFAVAVSLSSMLIIVGAAFLGAYRFLKNIGVFKGHYYY
jgi:hypothetical protein